MARGSEVNIVDGHEEGETNIVVVPKITRNKKTSGSWTIATSVTSKKQRRKS